MSTKEFIEETWLRETPPIDQKARADRIAWTRSIMRNTPRGPARRAARRRYRAEIKAFERVHLAGRSKWATARVVLMAAPFGLIAGSLVAGWTP